MTQRVVHQEKYPARITTNVKDRVYILDQIEYANLLHRIIIEACKLNSYTPLAFCIMSDHLHLLAARIKDASVDKDISSAGGDASVDKVISSAGKDAPVGKNISTLMHSIKSYFSQKLHKDYKFESPFWQPRYNYQVIDSKQRLMNCVEYIINNHHRAQLPVFFGQHPYLFVNHSAVAKIDFNDNIIEGIPARGLNNPKLLLNNF